MITAHTIQPMEDLPGRTCDESAPPGLGAFPVSRPVVAIVGMGCRLPGGVRTPDALWDLVRHGKDATGPRPQGRWDAFNTDPALLAGLPVRGGYLDDVAGFDAEAFGVAPIEAVGMDPQQRLVLEVSWEALADAGIAPESLRGSAAAVVIGAGTSDYGRLTSSELAKVDARTATGLSPAVIANRVSYLLDLRGPSLTVDTACSSSLVALHHAVRALQDHETDLALTGGVNVLVGPAATASFAAAGALAPDGRCKPFAAHADGIGRAEGCVVLVLKRWDDALRDGDHVLALVRGSAVNCDGRSNGLTAPNPMAQEDVLRRAYRSAGMGPGEVGYVETHGTGTPLGDPLEAAALAEVLGRGRSPHEAVRVGSIKAHVGHLEAAAGAAGVAITALALHHGQIPPALHAATPNPRIPFGRNGLVLPETIEPWPIGRPAAGVSAFGFGGTNAHVVLSPAPPGHTGHLHAREQGIPDPASEATVDGSGEPPPSVFLIGGASTEHVVDQAVALADWLDTTVDVPPLPAIAHTLARHRSRGRIAGAASARDRAGMSTALRALAADPRPVPVAPGPAEDAVWVFSGLGPVWPGMCRRLAAGRPEFGETLTELSSLLHRACGVDVLAETTGVVRAGAGPSGGAPPGIPQLLIDSASRFAVQLGLARLWTSLGARPAAVLGHSIGEVAAAVVAGALSVEEGVHVLVERAWLISSLEEAGGGGMAVVEASAQELAELLSVHPDVVVAVHAAPDSATVSGPAHRLAEVLGALEETGHRIWPLNVHGAGHSPAVDPLLPRLFDELAGIGGRSATTPFYGTVLDDPRHTPNFDAAYWAANARRPVRFTQAVAAAAADGHRLFLELSPHPVALVPVRATLQGARRAGTALATLRRGPDDDVAFAAAAGRLLLAGGRVDAEAVIPKAERVQLPPPSWRHVRYWPTTPAGAAVSAPADTGTATSTFRSVRPATSGSPPGASVTPPPGPEAGTVLLRGDPVADRAAVMDRLIHRISEVAGYPRLAVDPHRPLHDLGLDSLMAVRISKTLQTDTGVEVPPVLLLRGATPDEVAGLVVDLAQQTPSTAPSAVEASTTGPALMADHLKNEPGPEPRTRPQRPLAQQRTALGGRDTVERWVATVWQEVLGAGPVDVTMSMAAVAEDPALRRQIGSRLRSRLEPDQREALGDDALFAVPTVEAQAALLRPLLEAGDGPLRVLREPTASDCAPPLLLFHPAGVGCSTYQPLVSQLPRGFPIYGLERDDSLRTVESKAARYAALVREVQPEGPYRLAGWSFGGCLAYAVAHILSGQGQQVGLVALIDTIAPTRGSAEDERAGLLERFRRFFAHLESSYGLQLGLDPEVVAALPDEDDQITAVVTAMQAAGVPLSPAILEHQRASYLDTRVAERYRPPEYHGPTVLYRTASAGWTGMIDPRYEHGDSGDGWDVVAPGMQVVHVDGDHSSIIDPPYIDSVALHLGALLLG